MMSSRDSAFFAIDEDSGLVTLAKSLSDMNPPKNSFYLNVIAKDKAPSSNVGTEGANENSVYLAITVVDVNDHPPKFDRDVYYVSVRETKPVGEDVLTVHATDEDNGNHNSPSSGFHTKNCQTAR